MSENYCEVCELSFANKSQLSAHKRTVFHKQKQEAAQMTQVNSSASDNSYFGDLSVSNGRATAYLCNLCDAKCTSEQLYIAHLNGGRHQRKINQTRFEELKKCKDPSVYCQACDITLDPSMMQMHLEGNKHLVKVGLAKPVKRKSAESMEVGNEVSAKKVKPNSILAGEEAAAVKKALPYLEGSLRVQLLAPDHLVCQVCNYSMQNLLMVNEHLNTKQHIRRCAEVVVSQVKPSLTASNKKDIPKNSPFYCVVCNVGSTFEAEYNLHLNGFKHAYKTSRGHIDPSSPFAAKAQLLQQKIKKWAEAKKLKKAEKARQQAEVM